MNGGSENFEWEVQFIGLALRNCASRLAGSVFVVGSDVIRSNSGIRVDVGRQETQINIKCC